MISQHFPNLFDHRALLGLKYEYVDFNENVSRKWNGKVKNETSFRIENKNWFMHCWSILMTFLIYCLPVCAVSSRAVESISPSPFPTSTLFKHLLGSLGLTGTVHTFGKRTKLHPTKWPNCLWKQAGRCCHRNFFQEPLLTPHGTHSGKHCSKPRISIKYM